MKPSRKRLLSFLAGIVAFIAAMIVFNSFIVPSYQDIKTKRGEVAARKNLIKEYESSISEAKQFSGKYENVLKASKALSMILPTTDELPNIVNQVTALAQLNGLDVQRLSTRKLGLKVAEGESGAQRFGTLEIDLRVVGTYARLRAFLENIETNSNLMDLISIKISLAATEGLAGAPGSRSSADPDFGFDLVVNSYYQAEN